jgi:hypothetical protein
MLAVVSGRAAASPSYGRLREQRAANPVASSRIALDASGMNVTLKTETR